MRKCKLIGIVVVISLFLIISQVFAGGLPGTASKEVIGTPPEAMARESNITPHRGNGEIFVVNPFVEFLSRICSHHIQPGDKKPGPGWGVPEGHNIGNAPQPRVAGKQLDKSNRGKMEPIVDLFKRIEQEQAHKK